MQRGKTKSNRLEANSSPIAEPSVKAVSLKRKKMIETKKINIPECHWDGCHKSSEYEFNDAEVEVKIVDENDTINAKESVKTVIIGYSCPDHVEAVNQFLIMTKKMDKSRNSQSRR